MDLPLIWSGIIATAVLLYVLLDGFDLGIGILFPFAKPKERDVMTAAIAPVWDGNETWLVLGGGGLFAAFPLAYATIMPAMYLPIGIMLTALIFRGVAFEFRAKAGPSGRGRRWWTVAFAGGSIAAAIAQGFVLGGFVSGITIEERSFAGGAFDWLTPFSVLVAISLVLGYALLGAGWLILKADGELQAKARRWARFLTILVGFSMAAVSAATLSINPQVIERWGVSMTSVDWAKFLPVAPAPLLGALAGVACFVLAGRAKSQVGPYLAAALMFVAGYAGLAISIFPYVVPYALTIWDTAAADNSLGLMLVGVVILLPVILGYTAYVYWLFRGKATAESAYH